MNSAKMVLLGNLSITMITLMHFYACAFMGPETPVSIGILTLILTFGAGAAWVCTDDLIHSVDKIRES